MIYSELYNKMGLTNKNISIVKSLLHVLREKERITLQGQDIEFTKDSWLTFQTLWDLFEKTTSTCEYTHMPKIGFNYLFQILYSGVVLEEFVTLYGIFCPGYEGVSYKKRLGSTTVEKMKSLNMLSNIFTAYKLKHEIICIYADVFLENEIQFDNVRNGFNVNKTLFFQKSMQYFNKSILLSDFLEDSKIGEASFIDHNILRFFDKQKYDRFLNCNRQFYKAKGWDEQHIRKRNDELITLYDIVANKILQNKNSIYASIENINERASLFLDKKIPVLFISKN